jgi:hypothetical protein
MRKALGILVLCLTQTLAAESNKIHSMAAGGTPEAMLQDFIRAFDNLEWDRFRGFFDDDATVFYPRGFTTRASGRLEFEANFRKVFDQIRGNRMQPPTWIYNPVIFIFNATETLRSPRFISMIAPEFSTVGRLCFAR